MSRRIVLAAVLALIGCQSKPPPSVSLVVYGAASLTESLTEVSEAWSAQGRPAVTLSFGSSSQLARQIRAGAPADVFASADVEWMQTLEGAGALRPNTRHDLLGNKLVVVVPKTATFVPRALAELEDPSVRKIALAGEQVPAGRYADAVIEQVGRTTALAPKVTRGESVRTVLHWVADGELDAGFVYATDARTEDKVSVAFEIPAELQPDIVYPFAVLAGSQQPVEAEGFIAFCSSPTGRAIFERAGFSMLPP